MAKEVLTFFITSNSSSKMWKFKASKRLAFFLLSLLPLFFIVFLMFFYSNFYLGDLRQDNQRYLLTNAKHVKVIEHIQFKLTKINQYLTEVKTLDNKLRAITRLNDPDRHLALGPIMHEKEDLMSGKRLNSEKIIIKQVPKFFTNINKKMALLQDRQAWLLGQAEQRQESMKQLDNYFKQRTTLLSYTPSIWPVRGWTTSEFGIRRDPYTSRARMHRGLDIAAAIGTTVNSPADGLIIFTGKDGAFGKVVVVDHKNNIMTRYAHLSRIDVTTGDQVKRGEQLGAVGNTGRSTGPHLHYEVWINGIPENPRKYILN